MKQLLAVEVAPGTMLTEPLKKGWHSRGNHAYLVHDTVSNTLSLACKLTTLAAHLNQANARAPFEQVSARGLYEAADKSSGYTGGLHKMRYRVSRCDLAESHIAFEQARQAGIGKAQVLIEAVA